MKTLTQNIIQFSLPRNLACPQPTEERGIARDQVRLLVSSGLGHAVNHTTFSHLDEFLQAGDVLVVNTSATVAAAVPIILPDGQNARLHLSTQLESGRWLIEIRTITDGKTHRWKAGKRGMEIDLPGKGSLKLKQRFYNDHQLLDLWEAELMISESLENYLNTWGKPIKYDKLALQYPLDWYQTFFSFQPGSSEMPSAGRGFTPDLVGRLLAKGITFAPVLLHTGVSSLEENERPYPEYMEIDPVSAAAINQARAQGRRVIAVGTTAIRVVESAAGPDGKVSPCKGRTDLFIAEGYQMRVVEGLITGFHEPRASHLHMLQSLAGFEHIANAYKVALAEGYYWHEFGDLHLIMA